jgi:hypothetical protein
MYFTYSGLMNIDQYESVEIQAIAICIWDPASDEAGIV